MKTTCGIFIVTPSKKVLICHPTNHKWTLYSIPKGVPDNSETEIDTAIRETFEETGLDLSEHIDKMHPLPYSQYTKKNKKLCSYLYKSHTEIDVNTLHCDSMVMRDGIAVFPEIDEFRLVSLDEAEILLHESQAAMISLIKQLSI